MNSVNSMRASRDMILMSERWKFERVLAIMISAAFVMWTARHLLAMALFFRGHFEGPFGGYGLATIVIYLMACAVCWQVAADARKPGTPEMSPKPGFD